MIGQTLSHYEVLETIGSGGMGDVYLARDTELDRKVALKVLPPELSENRERRERFKREAKALAALNHPNIVAVYSVEQSDGIHFITMELVRGTTLSQLLPDEGFPLDRFFDIAIPLADAVAAAHQQGITHRDLKPDNVMVSDDRRLKVLDFGLAKESEAVRQEGSELPTEVRTHDGTILGTPHYMSPEQAEGKPVDARSDIFSLGIVLYQMATGERPFSGDSPVSVLSAILTKSPPSITERNPAHPPDLDRIIQHCLDKDRERRYQTAEDLRSALEELKERQASGASRPRVSWRKPAGIAAAVVMAATATYWLAREPGEATEPDSFRLSFEPITSEAGRELEPSLSPDGAFVVYSRYDSGQWDIYRQRLGGQRTFNLTEDFTGDDTQPAFSPDGERIAFRSERDGGGIFLMGATGESVRRLTDVGYNPSWSPDGRSLVVAAQPFLHVRIGATGGDPALWRIDVETGEKRLVFEGRALQPSWSPEGHRIAFWAVAAEGSARDIWTIDAEGGAARAVTNDPAVDWNPVWSADGRYLYFSSERGGSMNLWRVRIRETTGEVLREPEPITAPATFAAHLSVSSSGRRIAYAAIAESSDIYKIGFEPSTGAVEGDAVAVTRRSGLAVGADLSPDGERLTFMGLLRHWDIFVVGADGSGLRNLTDDPHNDRLPRWSPKGDRIAFYSTRSGNSKIWTIGVDGSGLRQLTDSPDDRFYPVWSPDGSRLVYRGREGTYLHELDGSARLLESQDPRFSRFNAHAWSPDGSWLAGELSTEDGGSGIVVYSLDSGELVSLTDFGWFPRWLSDSRRLVFSGGDGDGEASGLFLVDRESGETRAIYAPEDAAAEWVSLSPDERTIYFTRSSTESDIWLLTLEEPSD